MVPFCLVGTLIRGREGVFSDNMGELGQEGVNNGLA